ncbi:MAG: tetratricopeptide repeat protein [Deltaproteobacteria bacterium]|nr:tetratricopeptide repeat protein [Deltaproteobacteria bacterium]
MEARLVVATRLVVAATLVAVLASGCRGDHAAARRDEPATSLPATTPTTPAPSIAAPPIAAPPISSLIAALPQSPDGPQELTSLDLQIEQARRTQDSEALIEGLARRAMLRGRHEDYRAALDRARAFWAEDKHNTRALAALIRIHTQLHDFDEAEHRINDLRPLASDRSDWTALEATVAEARGKPELARDHRERTAKVHPTPTNLTSLAANLAMRGELDGAVAMIPRAAAALHDPSPVLISWLLVQWGRLYVQKGELAAARELFAEAHERLPGYVDATVQLATTLRATGGDPDDVVAAALVAEPHHPELLALAGRAKDAHAAWAVYLTPPLERAFADHAARFYLGPGGDPARALALATTNDLNRLTLEARTLLVEAELANGLVDPACRDARRLTSGTRAQQFVAWRAYTACGQTAEATLLAQTLGIR